MFTALPGTTLEYCGRVVDVDQRTEFGALSRFGHDSCYIVIVEFEYSGRACPVTHFVADETWLQILLEDLKPGRILSITWLRPSEYTLGWEAVDVHELFLQERDTGPTHRRLVVCTEANHLFDRNGKVVADAPSVFKMREHVRSLFVAKGYEPLGAKNYPFARLAESW